MKKFLHGRLELTFLECTTIISVSLPAERRVFLLVRQGAHFETRAVSTEKSWTVRPRHGSSRVSETVEY